MSPLSPGTPLFKTAPGESLNATPLQSSMSAAPPVPDPGALLTVGDILPQLPPEIARVGALPPEQSVAISAQVLDTALRSGHAAVPLFEVYRICPALFQAPVSPQDPRMVPLPASKLPRLIASTQQAQNSPAASRPAMPMAATSPFGSVAQGPVPAGSPPPTSGSPFGTAGAPSFPQNSFLPPRRQGPPPPLVDVPSRDVSSLALPAAAPPGIPASLASPSGSGAPNPSRAPVDASGHAPAGPTFGAHPASPLLSPFASPTPAKPSPFGALAPARPETPPFQAATSALAEDKPDGSSSLFGSHPGSAPAFAPQAGPPPSLFDAAQSTQPPPSATAQPANASAGGNIRVSLASVLKGYTAVDLGFDPLMVPSWIMTTLPAATVREQIATGNVVADVGTLIDSITDAGFRKLLATARRDFRVKLPTNELFHALSGTNPSTLAGLAKPIASRPPLGEPENSPASASAPGGDARGPEGVPLFSEAAPASVPAATDAPPSLFNRPTAPRDFATSSPAPAERAPIPFQAKAYDPFATPTPPPPAPAPAPVNAFQQNPSEGFSSEQLLTAFNEPQPPPPPNPFFAMHSEALPPSQVIEEQTATAGAFAAGPATAAKPESQPSFEPPALAHGSGQPASVTPAVPQGFGTRPAPSGPSTPTAAPSFVGVQRLNTPTDQILLRALLATDETLTAQRVVELTSQLPGIASCVCIQGHQSISHSGAHKPQAREFQRQATDLAQHLRTLAPLIGIEGAETFTLNAGDRLMTFCFPDHAILGVLHDVEPSVGLRDKITLIARELARMLG